MTNLGRDRQPDGDPDGGGGIRVFFDTAVGPQPPSRISPLTIIATVREEKRAERRRALTAAAVLLLVLCLGVGYASYEKVMNAGLPVQNEQIPGDEPGPTQPPSASGRGAEMIMLMRQAAEAAGATVGDGAGSRVTADDGRLQASVDVALGDGTGTLAVQSAPAGRELRCLAPGCRRVGAVRIGRGGDPSVIWFAQLTAGTTSYRLVLRTQAGGAGDRPPLRARLLSDREIASLLTALAAVR